MRFYSQSLLSKSGFQDGEILCDLLFDIEHELVADASDILLIEIVKTKMLPLIEQEVDLFTVGSHNPIRASHIDGIEVDLNTTVQNVKLTPEYIEIDDQLIIDLAITKYQRTR